MISAGVEGKRKSKIEPPHPLWLASPNRQNILLGFLVVAAIVAVYYPVGDHPFLNYDDDLYIVYNPHVQAGLQWATVTWAFTSFDASNWHPLTWLSHALDYQLFQLNPARHHEVNVLLHVVNVLLLFWVLRQATGYTGRSAMVASLFALHPINVESVAWIAERKNLLSMTFFLLALGAYHSYAEWVPRSSRGQREGGKIGRYVVVALLFACGLMAKPQVITLPFVLLLWDYWPLGRMSISDKSATLGTGARTRSFSWLMLEKLPLFALSVASAIITLLAQQEAGAMSGPHWQPFSIRIGNATFSYARYLGKAIWPAHLSLLYPHPGSSLRIWQVVAASLLLLAISALAIAERYRRPYLLIGWLWFLGTLVPMIGFVQAGMQAMADRYAYLPLVGLFIMAVWGVADFASERRIPPAWQAGVSVAVLAALAIVARQQLDYWSDNVKLWSRVVSLNSHAVSRNPDDWVAENNLGHALLNSGDQDDALLHFRAAVAINPSDADSTLNIGAYQQQHGNVAQAIEQYKEVIAITQDTVRLRAGTRAQAFRNMGHAYRQLGDYADAKESFQQAVNLNPADGESWLGLGIMAHKLGDVDAAIPAYSQALKVESLDWVYVLLAKALEQAGRQEEARAARQKASLLSKNFEQTQRTAEKVLAQ